MVDLIFQHVLSLRVDGRINVIPINRWLRDGFRVSQTVAIQVTLVLAHPVGSGQPLIEVALQADLPFQTRLSPLVGNW